MTERDSVQFHHVTQIGAQFKTYELLSSGMLHLIYSDHNWPQVTGTLKSQTTDEGILYFAMTALEN